MSSLAQAIASLDLPRRAVLEAVGPHRDLYLNVLPLLYDVSIAYKGRNEYLHYASCSTVDAAIIDGDASPECHTKTLIVRQGEGWEVRSEKKFVSTDSSKVLEELARQKARLW